MNDPKKLRELACWYREFAERTGNPTIWDARLRTAEDLEAEAARIERAVPRWIDESSARGEAFAKYPINVTKSRSVG